MKNWKVQKKIVVLVNWQENWLGGGGGGEVGGGGGGVGGGGDGGR